MNDRSNADDTAAAIGARHGFGAEAARALAAALVAGAGRQAQFSHPELGGMGQWSQGGMLMIGAMFDNALKARVDALANDLAEAVRSGAIASPRPAAGAGAAGGGSGGGTSDGGWWPSGLGAPSAGGSQNGRRYAVFPQAQRLAVEENGRVRLFDTGDHRIGGVSQAQGGRSDLAFSSQHGPVTIGDLREVEAGASNGGGQDGGDYHRATNDAAGSRPPVSASGNGGSEDVAETIRKLARLKDEGHLSAEEFAAKKTELLARI